MGKVRWYPNETTLGMKNEVMILLWFDCL